MKTNDKNDVFGKAIRDFYHGKEAVITTYSTLGGKDKLPVRYLFRTFEEMPKIEQTALKMATGKVLDIGCGAGSHADYLQKQGLSVKPIDLSEGAIEVCRLRGLKTAEKLDLWDLKNVKFDTILSLMNGAGICGSMNRVPAFLDHLKTLLTPLGQILIDSTDVIYMYEDDEGEEDLSELDRYYGEVQFQSSYEGVVSESYPWMYIDFHNLKQQALHSNLNCELVLEGSHHDYLARLTPMD